MKVLLPPRDLSEWLAAALVTVVTVSVIAGFVMIGGPGKARAEKQDSARMYAIADLADALACYRSGVGPLPTNLEGVREAIETPSSPARLAKRCARAKWTVDPVTGADFEVEAITPKTAQICAAFARPSRDGKSQFRYLSDSRNSLIDADAIRTEAGRYCYTANLIRGSN